MPNNHSDHHHPTTVVSDIRTASRELIREFGLMNKSVAGTDLSISAVHAIIEISRQKNITSQQLGELLHLEKSTISRLVRSLITKEEILEKRSDTDGRAKQLSLTKQGHNTLKIINQHADRQVINALDNVDRFSQDTILNGLKYYTRALRTNPDSVNNFHSPSLTIETGYAPTVIASVVNLMHLPMHRQFGFGAAFEARISKDIAEFVTRLASPNNRIWRAMGNGKMIGTISIDGENLGNSCAHLRWFGVDEKFQGDGIGKTLLSNALDFCDSMNYRQTDLWTVKGLDAARRLYEKHGFLLADEYQGDQWGKRVTEQKFTREMPSI